MSLNEVLQGQAQSLLPKPTTTTTTKTTTTTAPKSASSTTVKIGSTTLTKSPSGQIAVVSPLVVKTTPTPAPVSPAPSPVISSAFDFGLVQSSNQNISPDYVAAVEEVRSSPEGTIISTATPTFETTKQDIAKNIETISENQLSVLLSPGYSKFTDPLGNQYTKNEALAILGKEKTQLERNFDIVASYESQGYQLRDATGGALEFYKTPDQIRGEAITQKERQLKAAMTGSAEERLAGLGLWWSSGMGSMEDPLSIKSTIQAMTGDVEGSIRTKATAWFDLDTKDPLEFTLKWATGPLALIGTAFAGGAGIQAVEGRLAARAALAELVGQTGAKALAIKAAPMIFKGAMIGTGVAMGGLMAEDVYQTYQKDPLLAFSKGLTYAAVFGAGIKGYKEAGGSKGIAGKIKAAEDQFYEAHPERIRMVFMKKGVEAGSVKQTKPSAEWDLEGPVNKDFTNFSKQFQEHPENFKVSLVEQVEKPGQKTTGGLNWEKPEAEIFTSRGGTRAVSRFTLRGSKAYEPTDEWVAMSKSAADKAGPQGKIEYQGIRNVKGSELFAGEKGANERILYRDLDVTDITGRTGEVKTKGGKRIFDFETKRFEYSEDLFASERGGGGGITRTKTIPIMETELTSDLGDVFFTAGNLRIGSGAVIKSDIFFTQEKPSWVNEIAPGMTRHNPLLVFTRGGDDKTIPGFRGEIDVDVDTGPGWKGSGLRNKQGYEDIVDQFDEPMFDTGQQQDFTTITDTTFDIVPELTTETIPGFSQTPIPGFPFKAPGFSLNGFDDESGSLISLFGRTRNYRTGDLEKALKGFDKAFL